MAHLSTSKTTQNIGLGKSVAFTSFSHNTLPHYPSDLSLPQNDSTYVEPVSSLSKEDVSQNIEEYQYGSDYLSNLAPSPPEDDPDLEYMEIDLSASSPPSPSRISFKSYIKRAKKILRDWAPKERVTVDYFPRRPFGRFGATTKPSPQSSTLSIMTTESTAYYESLNTPTPSSPMPWFPVPIIPVYAVVDDFSNMPFPESSHGRSLHREKSLPPLPTNGGENPQQSLLISPADDSAAPETKPTAPRTAAFSLGSSVSALRSTATPTDTRYSSASSRTKSTDYGKYVRRMALSKATFDSDN